MPVPSTTRFCRLADGQTIAYATLGNGRPLVMVPGWLCHLDGSWGHPAAASARDRFAADHAFTWYDRLGCGLSDRRGFELSLENDVEQLCAVLDAARIERASLIGYSFGGPPAAVFAARYPHRVDRLVLYSTFARGSAITSPARFDALEQLVAMHWFQFSSLKDHCLRECRHPAAFLVTHYRRGSAAAFTVGRRHGMFCLGCCWALMLVMFSVGIANLAWMAPFALLMLHEKVAPGGARTVRPIGVGLIGLGLLVVIDPAGIPSIHPGIGH